MLDDLRELYQEVILDHGRAPRNFRRPETPTSDAEGHNPMCGDVVHVFLIVSEDKIVEDVAFEGKGCAISIASASLMTEIVKGRSVDDVLNIFHVFHDLCAGDGEGEIAAKASDTDMERLNVLAGVRGFPMRVKCATLAWHTMKAALVGQSQATTE